MAAASALKRYSTVKGTIVRLSAVSDANVERLLNRGISPESFPEIQERLRRLKIVIEPARLIDKVFEPSTNPKHPTPFAKTRFSNGDKAVFYSALEDETSIEEIRYHQTQSGEFGDLEDTRGHLHAIFGYTKRISMGRCWTFS